MDVHTLPIQWPKCDKMGRWQTWPLILFRWRAPNGAAVENRIKDERLWYGRPRLVNGVTFQPATKKKGSLAAGCSQNLSVLCRDKEHKPKLTFLCGAGVWVASLIHQVQSFVFVLMLKEGNNSHGLSCVETGLSKYIFYYLHLDGEVTMWASKKTTCRDLLNLCFISFFTSLFSLKKNKKNSESKPLPASQHHITAVQIWSGLFQFKYFKGALTLQQACKYLKGEITRLCRASIV